MKQIELPTDFYPVITKLEVERMRLRSMTRAQNKAMLFHRRLLDTTRRKLRVVESRLRHMEAAK